jgi:UDP-N-acetylmuramoylalanine--D-glutamate ligase
VIIGAARQGLALSRYLTVEGAQVTLNDRQSEAALVDARRSLADLPVEWVLGDHPSTLLKNADLVCISGGVPSDLPIVQEARRRAIPVSNDTQIFMEACPCRVIGITGSAGKTTTTTLVGRMAQFAADAGGNGAPAHVWVGGNIGLPLIGFVKEMRPRDLVVMEVSSFQLELTRISPQIAAILNITPNHLDRHGTMEAYTAAKANLLTYQTPDEWAILGADDQGAWSLRDRVNGHLVAFGMNKVANARACTYLKGNELVLVDGFNETVLMPRSSIALRGDHNVLNVLAACAVSYASGLPVEAMQLGVEGFGGVPHRLEFVRRWKDADWYNDSIATTPERTLAAIRSYEEPLVLMLGGRDKKLPWEDLAKLIHDRVDHVVIFGEAAEKICKAIGSASSERRPYSIDICHNLKDAVQAAANRVSAGDVVLLSPGGTSFDEFKDFEDRGENFRLWVQQLQ